MDGLNIKATARVRLTKLDADGNVVDIEEHDVDLTKKEAEEIWLSQQQA